MSINTTRYVRKPLYVEAVQVTEENFEELALWCQGRIVDADGATTSDASSEPFRYISVRVTSPMTPRQSQARIGDWILWSTNGYKVYNAGAFSRSFDEAPNQIVGHQQVDGSPNQQKYHPDSTIPVSAEAERVAVIKQEVAEGHLTHGQGEALFVQGAIPEPAAVGTGPMPEHPKPTDVEETHPPALPPNMDEVAELEALQGDPNVVYPTSPDTTAAPTEGILP